MRSSTRRCIRSSSSRASACVARTSSGSSGSSSSRWPRTIVSGVRSSWPTSSRSSRCDPKARSSRSSIAFTVRAMFGQVVLAGHGDALGQVRLGDPAGGVPQQADRPQQAPDDEPGDDGDDSERREPDGGVGEERAAQARHLGGAVEGDDEHAGARVPVEEHRHGDEPVLRGPGRDRPGDSAAASAGSVARTATSSGSCSSRSDARLGCGPARRLAVEQRDDALVLAGHAVADALRAARAHASVNGRFGAWGRPCASHHAQRRDGARQRVVDAGRRSPAACSANAVPPAIITVSARAGRRR